MHRSQSQCPKGSTACSSRIWDEQTRHRQATLTAESAIWLKTRMGWGIPDSAARWNLKGTSNRGPWVCRKRTWTPSSLCLVSFCSGWEAIGSSLQASREKHKMQLLSSLVTLRCPSEHSLFLQTFWSVRILGGACLHLEPGNTALRCYRTACSRLRTGYSETRSFKVDATQTPGRDWIGKIVFFSLKLKTFLRWLSADILPPTKQRFIGK